MATSIDYGKEENPRVAVRVEDSLVLDSGVVVLTSKEQSATFNISNLSFDLAFEGRDGRERGVEIRSVSSTRAQIVLTNFDNPLGTAFGPLKIADISGQKAHLSCAVYALGDRTRIVHYSILWGGEYD